MGHLHRLAGFAGLDSGDNGGEHGGGDVASGFGIEDSFTAGVKCAGLTGAILIKLDGDARGGGAMPGMGKTTRPLIRSFQTRISRIFTDSSM